MKKSLKAILAVALAAAVVFCICNLTAGNKLKASEEEGGVSASEQQEERRAESEPETVEVEQPAEKEEEPAAEENAEAAPEETAAEPVSEEVPAEEAAATEEVPAEAAATEEPAEEEEPEIKVNVKIENKGNIYLGDTVTMSADVTGAPEGYSLTWQYNDGNGWKDLGKSGEQYSFVVDEQNSTYDYRAVVNY